MCVLPSTQNSVFFSLPPTKTSLCLGFFDLVFSSTQPFLAKQTNKKNTPFPTTAQECFSPPAHLLCFSFSFPSFASPSTMSLCQENRNFVSSRGPSARLFVSFSFTTTRTATQLPTQDQAHFFFLVSLDFLSILLSLPLEPFFQKWSSRFVSAEQQSRFGQSLTAQSLQTKGQE